MKVSGKLSVILIVVVALLLTVPASAKDGLYLGASVGRTTLEIDDLDIDVDEFDYQADSTTTKFIAGYRFLAFLAVEASYVDFGSLEDSAQIGDVPVSVATDLTAFDACAMGLFPLGIADVFAKAGVVSWDSDIRAAFDDIVSYRGESGTDLVYGVGGQVRFKGLAVRAEVEYFDLADADSLYLVSVGATYTF